MFLVVFVLLSSFISLRFFLSPSSVVFDVVLILQNSASSVDDSLVALYALFVPLLVTMVTSPFISTIWCSRPYISESLSSGDDIDGDEDTQKDKNKDKDTQTQTKTDTKCFQDPMYAIFIKSKNLKCDIGCLLLMKKTKTWWTWTW